MENIFNALIQYDKAALSPILSQETIDYHYGKHHCGYAKTLNQLISKTKFTGKTLEEIIICSRNNDQKIFNNASQLFNHDFYWKCLQVSHIGPSGRLGTLIAEQFGSLNEFLNQYIAFASNMFGSGWSWLVEEKGELTFTNTQNAENPIGSNKKPICVIDLWEHAYYIDYRNDRASYICKILTECINWQFCDSQLSLK